MKLKIRLDLALLANEHSFKYKAQTRIIAMIWDKNDYNKTRSQIKEFGKRMYIKAYI